ncbi:hypothetical protein K652_27813 [Pseudomonas aeruginosa VRFPA02]|nr:hypothetical protein K652_27813 [Pseudomonas aeruginosa VRFPA02]SST08997.1 Uncharacterised protein [Acinetobacter baumannii]
MIFADRLTSAMVWNWLCRETSWRAEDTSSTAISSPCGSNTGLAEQVRPVWRLRKCSSCWMVRACRSTTQVPMPLVPSQGSLQSAPSQRPACSKVWRWASALTQLRITPRASVSSTAWSLPESCW